jgi:hypothetical protein
VLLIISPGDKNKSEPPSANMEYKRLTVTTPKNIAVCLSRVTSAYLRKRAVGHDESWCA